MKARPKHVRTIQGTPTTPDRASLIILSQFSSVVTRACENEELT